MVFETDERFYPTEDPAESIQKHLRHAGEAAAQLAREKVEAADVIDALLDVVYSATGAEDDLSGTAKFAECLRGADDGAPFTGEAARDEIGRIVQRSSARLKIV